MSLIDFCNRSKTVRRGGVVVRCHPPTVETMHLLLMTCSTEVIAAAKIALRLELPLGDDPVSALLPLFTADRDRAVDVLETCCKPAGGRMLGECCSSDPGLVPELARAVVGLCNVQRVIDSLCLRSALDVVEAAEEDPSKEPVDEGPSPQELSVVSLAQRFGIDPSVICAWPYERFLSVWECIAELSKREREAAGVEEEFNDWAVREIESRG